MTASKAEKREYWFLFWDQTSLTVAARSLQEAEEEMVRRSAPLHLMFAVVLK